MQFAEAINAAIQDCHPSIDIISEPGRYYVNSSFSSASFVHSKKTVTEGDEIRQMYYVNDGVYGSFIEELLDLAARQPKSLFGVSL